MQDRTVETVVMNISDETAGRACFTEETAYFDGE